MPLAAEIPAPAACRRRPPADQDADRRANCAWRPNLSMQPKDAAEISDMFFSANSSERALILHNLVRNAAAGFGAHPGGARGARDRDAGDGGLRCRHRKLHARTQRGADFAGADRGAGGQRSRRRAARLRRARAGHAERGVSAGADVSQSRVRVVGSPMSIGCRGCTTA